MGDFRKKWVDFDVFSVGNGSTSAHFSGLLISSQQNRTPPRSHGEGAVLIVSLFSLLLQRFFISPCQRATITSISPSLVIQPNSASRLIESLNNLKLQRLHKVKAMTSSSRHCKSELSVCVFFLNNITNMFLSLFGK